MKLKVLGLGVLFIALVSVSGNAQTSGGITDPDKYLAVPPNGIQHYQKFEQATRRMEEQKWAEAESIWKELSKAYPLHGGTWGQLGISLRRQKKHAEAIQAYERVMEIQGPGHHYNARYWIAVSQAALGQTEAALDNIEKMVFQEADLGRHAIPDDENFASLKDNPRMKKIAGREDVSKLTRNEAWQYDIDFLLVEFKRTNPWNAPVPEEFYRRHRELKDAVPNLTDLEIVAGIGRLIHSLDRGHTGLWLGAPGSKLDFRSMPVRFYIFPEGIFITQAGKGHEKLAGAQVLKFGNTPAIEALRMVGAARSSESPMENLLVSPLLLSYPAVLNGVGITKSADSAELTLKMPDGTTLVQTLEPGEPAPPSFKLTPPPGIEPPLFLRNLKEMHWFESLPEHQAIYVQVNNIMPDEDETMAQFGLRLRKSIQEIKPRNIILDIRHNNGGNTFTYPELLRTLTAFSTIEGNKVYALIGRNVYSAAANLSADLERLVRPIFVGEPTGAAGNQWGDESIYVLPYSGIMGAFAGVRWQTSHPWDQRRCIVPQFPVQLTAKAYFEGRDPALEAIFQTIHLKKE